MAFWLGCQRFWEVLICKWGCQSPAPKQSGNLQASPNMSALIHAAEIGFQGRLWFTREECLVDSPTEPADCGYCFHFSNLSIHISLVKSVMTQWNAGLGMVRVHNELLQVFHRMSIRTFYSHLQFDHMYSTDTATNFCKSLRHALNRNLYSKSSNTTLPTLQKVWITSCSTTSQSITEAVFYVPTNFYQSSHPT